MLSFSLCLLNILYIFSCSSVEVNEELKEEACGSQKEEKKEEKESGKVCLLSKCPVLIQCTSQKSQF